MKELALERLVPDFVRRFEPYVPSRPDDELKRLYGVSHLHRLNNNENPLGPPRSAREAIRSFDPGLAAVYPSGDAAHLRKALGARHGRSPEGFLVGNGANEVIGFVLKAFCREGDNVVTADRTFAVYEWNARFSGVDARLVPLRDGAFDDEGLLARIDERTRVVFLCNPNNPTGAWWDRSRLVRFLDAVDGRAIVVLDEAYAEFVESPDYPDGVSLVEDFPNVVVFRTYSKMWGLAALRVGWLYADIRVVDTVRRTCVVYSVNALAQLAAEAVTTAADAGEHVEATRRLVREGKEMLSRAAGRLGLPITSGEGPFVILGLPVSDSLAYRSLMSRGVMVRTMTGFRFPDSIRVSIGLPEALEAFVSALGKLLARGNA